ncbi:MBL fold metallo-hydrolase [Actinomadura macrotermitis]|uniref:Hydroxyacylglutathione hydrolase n=1 Tax=Actinomadura macrotermitis TaxID=2585200 RepID=A0A7K0C2S1_9ACTN|nr:MBL fold metallo-hydrolase [Actinomadura macrotermitis]MQY07735.1 Hydroxyacylglutathione hydrolase [Actinomadura macrotermitis]
MSTAPPPRLEEIADRVYAWIQPDGTWCLNNAGFLVGPDAVTVIDTAATEARARGLRAAIAAVTPLAPRTVVNTHFHGDHTYGNVVFAGEAAIVAHENCAAEMIEHGLLTTQLWTEVEWGDIRVVPPTVTFTDRLTLHAGDLTAELIHHGPAHTTGDVVAWLPGQRVLFTGDLIFNGGTPFVLMGSVRGWLRTLDELRALGPETIVPGHGPVCGPEVLDRTEGYLRWLQELARDGIAAGLSPLALARETDLGVYREWTDPERLVGNLHRAYSEALGEPPGTPLDSMAAIMEMVEYNGGRIPTCLA